jgi:RimJ/RimL family protein N-acetyltransferase
VNFFNKPWFSHGDLYIEGSKDHPELFQYLPWGPFTLESLQQHFEIYRRDNTVLMLAIIDKTRVDPRVTPDLGGPGSFAGTIGLLNTSPVNLITEIGAVTVFPPFQRTHVTTNAIGILLHYCLEEPLRLRRVQWQAHWQNVNSVRTAEGMCFLFEGIQRWQRVLPKEKEGKRREGDEIPGRDSAVLSICWDDWERKEKVKVKTRMDRRGPDL